MHKQKYEFMQQRDKGIRQMKNVEREKKNNHFHLFFCILFLLELHTVLYTSWLTTVTLHVHCILDTHVSHGSL